MRIMITTAFATYRFSGVTQQAANKLVSVLSRNLHAEPHTDQWIRITVSAE